MDKKPVKKDLSSGTPISPERRRLLKLCILGFAQYALQPLQAHAAFSKGNKNRLGHLKYFLHDESTELMLTLEARGFVERAFGSRRCLKVDSSKNPRIIITFPPQHYLETALPFTKLPADRKLTNDQIKSLERTPSEPTRLVFSPKQSFKKLDLVLEKILNWDDLELVLPDHHNYGEYVAGKGYNDQDPKTYIEIPWGVVFSPRYADPAQVNWIQQLSSIPEDEWKPIWNAIFKEPSNSVELAGVTGFKVSRPSDPKTILVEKDGTLPDMGRADRNVPLTNVNRLEIVANLTSRFPYTGVPDPREETFTLKYKAEGDQNHSNIRACYKSGRELRIRTLILSSKGAWLEVDASWEAPPGCGLTAWTHSTAMGRDQHVKLAYAGYLYPFGTPATLIIMSERVFLKDPADMYIAVLIKQAYLEIPRPNNISLSHSESPLRSISVTTSRTPPLDLPSTGDPADWAKESFFTPMVDGTPFQFEHAGHDWTNNQHRSSMSHIFVTNRMRSANGRIWEPGYEGWTQAQAAQSAKTVNRETPTGSTFTIPGDGLREVDKQWLKKPYRFARYEGRRMALAEHLDEGDTSQRVEWIEWVRGPIGDLSEGPMIIDPPFIPRLRTAKIQLESTSTFSGSSSFVIGCYRDTRFVDKLFMDPEPNANSSLYADNLIESSSFQKKSVYFHLLEPRSLISVAAGSPDLNDNQQQREILESYYSTAATSSLDQGLFENTKNEIIFGVNMPTDKSGALAMPDTHAVALSRQFGVIGDATFNTRRWKGIGTEREKLEGRLRLDYSAYRKKYRNNLDQAPFDATIDPSLREAQKLNARALMGFSNGPLAAVAGSNALMSLGEIFGADAEIIPGISFAKVFESILLDDGVANIGAAPNLLLDASGNARASEEPFRWNISIMGVDWLLDLLGDGPDKVSIPELIEIAKINDQPLEISTPVNLGFSANVDWETRNFPKDDVDFGLVIFRARDEARAKIKATAQSSISLDEILGQSNRNPISTLSPRISSEASIENVAIEVFKSIEVAFSSINFKLEENGDKNFDVSISDITLKGPLGFINQLADALSSVGSGYGINIDVSFDKVIISQTLKFPQNDGQPLFIGPAQVIDLAMTWAVRVPFIGRDVISISFSISSRKRPLTIYVPPWYGGKAYFLIELTTKGVRMLEVSMEYGALVPIVWGIARGQASFTAGIFYGIYKSINDDGELTNGKVTYTAFVKASANLDIAGIIHFSGLVYIALTIEENSQTGVDTVKGESTISVSIKIGFVRLSYSFTAAYEERQAGSSDNLESSSILQPGILPMRANMSVNRNNTHAARSSISIYDRPLSSEQEAARKRIISGYL